MQSNALKVLVIGTCSPHVANHISRIKDDDIIVEVISNGKKYFEEKENIHLVDFSLLKFWNLWVTVSRIRKVIRTFNPDVIHIHQANSVAFYALLANKKFKLPTILTAWGSDILLNPKKSMLLKLMVQYNLRHADFFSSDSIFMAEEMQRLIPDKKLDITICNFGVTPIELMVNKKDIIYSNRNHNPLYRIDKVIEGFERFSKTEIGKNWKLIIAGAGSETSKLKALVADRGLNEKITFVGFVNKEENYMHYAEAKIFVSLPESDATSISLLEALYYQCIPVLSELPANKEWVTDNVNGIIVSDLEGAYLERALLLDQQSVGQKNRDLILENGTEEVSKKNFRNLLLKAIAK